MKKYVAFLLVAVSLVVSCSDKSEDVSAAEVNNTENIAVPEYDKKVFSYQLGELQDGCPVNSAMICAINQAAKCTINPKHKDCDKQLLPSFIFMEDESLQRPTEMSFRVYKLKPINGGLVEVYTESMCNGGWFGLCKGTIIYVLAPQGENWKVDNIYAVAQSDNK